MPPWQCVPGSVLVKKKKKRIKAFEELLQSS